MVNASQHAAGQRAHLLFQALSENDTHCLQFSYFMYSRDGHSPGTLSAYVRVTGGPVGSAVWNASGSHGRQWHQAELAVSLFWPNEYQVSPPGTPPRVLQTRLSVTCCHCALKSLCSGDGVSSKGWVPG